MIEEFTGPRGLRGYGRVHGEPTYGNGTIEVQESSSVNPHVWVRTTCDEDWLDRPEQDGVRDYGKSQMSLHMNLDQARELREVLDLAILDMAQREEELPR